MTNALQQDSFLAQASFIAFGKGVQPVSEYTFAETGHFFPHWCINWLNTAKGRKPRLPKGLK